MVSFFETSVFTEKNETETVEEFTVDNYIEINGIVLRSEKLLTADKNYEEIRYFQEDGDRIAAHSAFASYYDTPISSADLKRLEYLNRNISRLEESIDKSTQYSLQTIDKNIKENIIEYLNKSDSKDFDKVVSLSYDVQTVFDQKLEQQYGSSYIQGLIDEMKSEMKSIYSSNNAQETTLYSPSAGFFLSFVDGYEYISMDDYVSPTVQVYNELISLQPEYVSSLCVGKLQHYSNWCFIALIPADYVNDLYVGKTVYLDFTVNYSDTVRAKTVVSSISRANEGNCAVRFNCSTLTADLFKLRKETPKMILKSISGMKVSNESLRVVNGQTGVYVLSAQRILFKPINIVYATETYSIVEAAVKSGDKVLKVKDEVIIGGKDLYDGKIINISND